MLQTINTRDDSYALASKTPTLVARGRYPSLNRVYPPLVVGLQRQMREAINR